MHRRDHWVRRGEQLDPVRDSHQISLHVSAYDFPRDNLQALSFALLRTHAVPSIGRLLDQTGEFTNRVQKRYVDTGLVLEEVQRYGFASDRGRSAVRRINQMRGTYDISNEWVVQRFAYSVMDEPLARAIHYPVPSRFERAFFRGALKLRAGLLRLAPARSEPKWVSQYGYCRTYPAGYDIGNLGIFSAGPSAEAR